MDRRRWKLTPQFMALGIALFLMFPILASPVQGQSDAEEIVRRTQEIYRSDSINPEIPGVEDLGGRIGSSSRRTEEPEESNIERSGGLMGGAGSGSGDSALMQVVLFGLLGLLLVLGLVSFYGSRTAKARARETGRTVSDVHDAQEEMESLPSHVQLAEEGRFGEAIRTLLALFLEQRGEVLTSGVRMADTGREVLARARTDDPGTPLLRDLVQTIERGVFAGHGITQETYEILRGRVIEGAE